MIARSDFSVDGHTKRQRGNNIATDGNPQGSVLNDAVHFALASFNSLFPFGLQSVFKPLNVPAHKVIAGHAFPPLKFRQVASQ